MSAQTYSLCDRPVACAITIPVDNSGATLESLVAATSTPNAVSTLTGKQVLSIEIQQHGTNFNYGHGAGASCVALAATGTALVLPCLRTDQIYLESTTGSTISAVCVLFVENG